jgi:hypothetical protein
VGPFIAKWRPNGYALLMLFVVQKIRAYLRVIQAAFSGCCAVNFESRSEAAKNIQCQPAIAFAAMPVIWTRMISRTAEGTMLDARFN